MDQDLKVKWCEALRSGKYKQTKGALRKGQAFCCLGVLCEVSGVKTNDSALISDGRTYLLLDGDMQRQLSTKNDTGLSFPEIADWIEANL